MRLRLLDWEDSNLISITEDTSATSFGWTFTDRAELEDLTTIIARLVEDRANCSAYPVY